ncbi:hypothetical protein BDF20DRAFT_684269 [Mycotypha africana]|uniref:uncharacterized protein n=1 Tax=Mycotypha africana TaxID=64632 RepID=UPI0023014E30|nr:uncharacterized protein BDF20DRAFT_684269 [Mycotypha africana]KAI8971527.1 hypothetical protein BDF20DRAFT_684269 [Mycotypha africana]
MKKHAGTDAIYFKNRSLDTNSFEFALRQFIKVINPTFQLRKTNLLEDAIKFLRSVNYPFVDSINPTTLTPIGARHNLPQQLGILKWLAELCEILLDDTANEGDDLNEIDVYSLIDHGKQAEVNEEGTQDQYREAKTAADLQSLKTLMHYSLNTYQSLSDKKTDHTVEDASVSSKLQQIHSSILQEKQDINASVNEVVEGLQSLDARRDKIDEISRFYRIYQEDLKKYEASLAARRAKQSRDEGILQQIAAALEGAQKRVDDLRKEKAQLLQGIKSTNMTEEESKTLLEQSREEYNKRAADEAKIQEINTLIERKLKQVDESNNQVNSFLKEFELRISSTIPSVFEGEDLSVDFVKDDSMTPKMKVKKLEDSVQTKLKRLTENARLNNEEITRRTGEVRNAYNELIELMETQKKQLKRKRLEWDQLRDQVRQEQNELDEEVKHYNKLLDGLKEKIAKCCMRKLEYDNQNFMKLKLKEQELTGLKERREKLEMETEELEVLAKETESFTKEQNKDADDFFKQIKEAWASNESEKVLILYHNITTSKST